MHVVLIRMEDGTLRTEPYAHTLGNITNMRFEFLDEFEELTGTTIDVSPNYN